MPPPSPQKCAEKASQISSKTFIRIGSFSKLIGDYMNSLLFAQETTIFLFFFFGTI
jgi:hypothetical protein